MTQPDGGYFAAPLPVPASYGPVVPGQLPPGPVESGLPPLVVAAATSLSLAGIASLWLGLTMLTAGSAVGDYGYGSGSFGPRGSLLTLNGLANAALIPMLLRGAQPARWAATAICGGWVLYWLYQVTRATQAFADLGIGSSGLPGLGGLTFMATLGLLLLAGWAAATGGVLWTGRASGHFTQH